MRAKAGYSGRPGKGPLVSVTAAAALKSTEAALTAVTPDAAFEAAELVCSVLGVTKTRLYLNRQAALTAGQQRRLQSLVRRRQQGQPLQYLLGRWSFYNVELLVGPGVLIPRADTEILVQQLLQKGGVHCDACGHAHHCDVEEVLLGSGVAFSRKRKDF